MNVTLERLEGLVQDILLCVHRQARRWMPYRISLSTAVLHSFVSACTWGGCFYARPLGACASRPSRPCRLRRQCCDPDPIRHLGREPRQRSQPARPRCDQALERAKGVLLRGLRHQRGADSSPPQACSMLWLQLSTELLSSVLLPAA